MTKKLLSWTPCSLPELAFRYLSCKLFTRYSFMSMALSYVNDKNMHYFCCVTQCFSLSLITHKLKLNISDNGVAFSQILRGGFFYLKKPLGNPP